LSFLSREDWQAIAGQAESDELRAAKSELESVNNELGKVARRIEVTTAAMESDDVDVATIKVLGAQLSKAEAALAILNERKEQLQANVSAATAKSAALYDPEALLRLIRENSPEANEVRMRLRTEIRKRVSKIGVLFTPNGKIGVGIRYINEIQHYAWIDGDKPMLLVRRLEVINQPTPAQIAEAEAWAARSLTCHQHKYLSENELTQDILKN
jgi:hypothetical protein